MASARYTRNIVPDEQPQSEPAPMTRRQKWDNFWFYYKWYIIGAAFVLAFAGMLVKDIVFQVRPDYTISLLTQYNVPDSVCASLQAGFETLCDDRNGDGKVAVQVLAYSLPSDVQQVDPNLQVATVAKLAGDIETGETMLFLTDEPVHFAQTYAFFACNDGTPVPEGGPADAQRLGVRWGDCAALTALDLGDVLRADGTPDGDMQEYMENFYLLRRVYTDEQADDADTAAYYEASMRLFAEWTGH